MAGFNVQEFKSVIDGNKGLMRNNKFLVQMPAPRLLRGVLSPGVGNSGGEVMSFYCKASPLPGLGILTQDIYRYGYGPIERKPYGTVVNDAMMMFYVDGNNMVRKWFRHWIRLIINPDTEQGINSTYSVNNAKAYEMAYKDEYAVDIRVTAFDPEGNEVISVVMVESFPNFIGDVMQDWDDKHSNMIMPVSITYRDWYEDTVTTPGTRPTT